MNDLKTLKDFDKEIFIRPTKDGAEVYQVSDELKAQVGSVYDGVQSFRSVNPHDLRVEAIKWAKVLKYNLSLEQEQRPSRIVIEKKTGEKENRGKSDCELLSIIAFITEFFNITVEDLK